VLKDPFVMKIPCSPVSCRGFTRADLLGVLSIGLLLTLLVVASGSVTRSTAEAVACLSNHRHVIRAWSEHARDNRFLLRHRSGFPPEPTWGRTLDWTSSRDNTNSATVLTPEFRPYVGNDAGVFRCPSDRFLSSEQTRLGWRYRVRTVSMNAHVGAESTDWGGIFPTYTRLDDFTEPSGTFVFIEEHPGSINDASFATDPVGARAPNALRLLDSPAAFHARGGHLGFADGHAELHRWVGSRVVQPVAGGRPAEFIVNIPLPNDPDLIWLGLHASQLR
jgi:prepilin-type processing-associated H-X9-DG protein